MSITSEQQHISWEQLLTQHKQSVVTGVGEVISVVDQTVGPEYEEMDHSGYLSVFQSQVLEGTDPSFAALFGRPVEVASLQEDQTSEMQTVAELQKTMAEMTELLREQQEVMEKMQGEMNKLRERIENIQVIAKPISEVD